MLRSPLKNRLHRHLQLLLFNIKTSTLNRYSQDVLLLMLITLNRTEKLRCKKHCFPSFFLLNSTSNCENRLDPLRESAPYLEIAKKRGATIKYVLESHFHADFVSGHLSLASKTNATIIYGPEAKAGYEIHVAKDNENIRLGTVSIQVKSKKPFFFSFFFSNYFNPTSF